MHEYLHHFVAARYARVSAALSDLALVVPRCLTDQYSRSFLPSAVKLWNLLLSDVVSGSILSLFKGSISLCLLRD